MKLKSINTDHCESEIMNTDHVQNVCISFVRLNKESNL